MDGLSWGWIAVMVILPLPLGMLVAAPVWLKRETILGNIAGTAVIFGMAFGLIFREAAELDRLRQACVDAGGIICWPTPAAFMRYALYAGIGLLEVIALFVASLSVEKHIRDKDYAPEWRR